MSKMPEPVDSSAIFGNDMKNMPEGKDAYRYHLSRTWENFRKNTDRRVVFIMLNPSTADAEINDPTVRRCMGYTYDWGYRHLDVLNIFALRSTDPKALYEHRDPIGPHNHTAILKYAQRGVSERTSPLVVCAWGEHGKLFQRGSGVRYFLRNLQIEHHYLKLNASGEPCHPLYLAKNLMPTPWV